MELVSNSYLYGGELEANAQKQIGRAETMLELGGDQTARGDGSIAHD